MATSLYKPSSKLSKSPSSHSQSLPSPSPKPFSSSSSSSSLSTHLAMVELKSKVLAALSKLSDRDTQQIAIDELECIIRTLLSDGVPILLGSLTHEPLAPPPPPPPPLVAMRRELLRLIAALCAAHPDATAAHLPKIVAHLVRRLKNPASDSSVRDAYRDSASALSAIYLRPLIAATEAGGSGSAGSPQVPQSCIELEKYGGDDQLHVGRSTCLRELASRSGKKRPNDCLMIISTSAGAKNKRR